MNIAFISYEYPPDTNFGGISTYVYQLANALSKNGINVFVIAGTPKTSYEAKDNNITVKRIKCNHRNEFRQSAVEAFISLNKEHGIDLIESPEFGADGYYIKEHFPAIPLVVKFHTPSFLVKRFNDYYKKNRLKNFFKKVFCIKQYNKKNDIEYLITKKADALTTPSVSLGDIISNEWNINRSKIQNLANPYVPAKTFLDIDPNVKTGIVTYFGRLEERKGITALAEAAIICINKRADVKFRFVGKSMKLGNGQDAVDYIKTKVNNPHRLEFINFIPAEQIPFILTDTEICVFPSIWENFPNVCLEAMSAAKGIVASKEGGMTDMLEDIHGGILVSPFSAKEIANAIEYLLDNPGKRKDMAIHARKKVVDYYASSLIEDTVKFYQQVIHSKKNSAH